MAAAAMTAVSSWWSGSSATGAENVAPEEVLRSESSDEALNSTPEAELTPELKAQRVDELRRKLLDSPEGKKAASDLVQGGELKSEEELTSDEHLGRWMKARNYNVEYCYKSILNHATWRVTVAPEGRITEASIRTELEAEKIFFQGCDNLGRPVAVIQVRKHNAWSRDLGELERLCCFVLDHMIAACDKNTNPSGQCCLILDLSGIGTTNLDVTAMKAIFSLLGRHYVERLGAMYFYNPPYIFWGAWNTLSGLLPPVTRSKIHVVDPSQQDMLTSIIPSDVLPSEYGGAAPLKTIEQTLLELKTNASS